MNDESILFSWLHLSDVHFSPHQVGKKAHQALIVKTLLEDLEIQRGNEVTPTPDVIFLTGDIAFHGGAGNYADEYAVSLDWLDRVSKVYSLSRSHVFVVPGNHDVERWEEDSDDGRWLREFRHSLPGTEKCRSIDDAFANPPSTARLRSRFRGYLEFARQLNPSRAELYWSECLPIGRLPGLAVRVLGLNTALLANDDEDRRKLQLGYHQLSKVSGGHKDAREIAIALTHHPLRGEWLADEDESRRWLAKCASIHLFGHVHDADFQRHSAGSGAAYIEVASGAVSGDTVPASRDETFGYSFGAIAIAPDGGFEVRLWPRRLNDRHKMYRADTYNLEDYASLARHPLRTSFSLRDFRAPKAHVYLSDVCRPGRTLQEGLEQPERPHVDGSALFVLLLRVRRPEECKKCAFYLESNPLVESFNDVFGPYDFVAKARSKVKASLDEHGNPPSDVAELLEQIREWSDVDVMDVTREHVYKRLTATACKEKEKEEEKKKSRAVKAFVHLCDDQFRNVSELARMVTHAVDAAQAATSPSAFLLAVYESASRRPAPAMVLAEFLVACGGYYDLVPDPA